MLEVILALWHSRHSLHHWPTSAAKPFQTKRVEINLREARITGCWKQWPLAARRHVTQKLLLADWDLGDVKGRAAKKLLSSWTAMLVFGHGC